MKKILPLMAVLMIAFLASAKGNTPGDTLCYSVIDASQIRGRFNNENLNRNIPDSFYVNLKNEFIGKKFIQQHDGLDSYLYRLSDCSDFNINKNDTLKCIDVCKVINYPLLVSQPPVALIFKAPNNEICWTILEHSKIYIKDLDVITEQKAEYIAREKLMIKKYGSRNGRLIAQKRVVIGFSKQMCKDAWGEPLHINTTTTKHGVHEQWVYSGGYLYFDNGKLATIQN